MIDNIQRLIYFNINRCFFIERILKMARRKKTVIDNDVGFKVKSITSSVQPIYDSCDGFSRKIIHIMEYGETFECFGIVNGFYKIKSGGLMGYVPTYMLERM